MDFVPGSCCSVPRVIGAAVVALSVAALAVPPASADSAPSGPKPGDPCLNTEADSLTADGKLICAQDGAKFVWLNAHMKGAVGEPCEDAGAKVFGFGYPLPIITCTKTGSGLTWK